MAVKAVRGAIRVENDPLAIQEAVGLLMRELSARNSFLESDIISIVFSQTEDITAANPATALRRSGFAAVPLFCTQEPRYAGSVPGILRVLVTFNTDRDGVIPAYLNGAERLRSDLDSGGGSAVR